MELKVLVERNASEGLYTMEIDKDWWAMKYGNKIENEKVRCSYAFKYSSYKVDNEFTNNLKTINDIKWEAFIVLTSTDWKEWTLQTKLITIAELFI